MGASGVVHQGVKDLPLPIAAVDGLVDFNMASS